MIDRLVRDTTNWAQRDRLEPPIRASARFLACYPDNDSRRPQFRGIAKEMIERRREQKSLQALDQLIAHLATLRDERKFVVLLSEGWVLFRQNVVSRRFSNRNRSLDRRPASASRERAHHDRRGISRPSMAYDRGFASCERERSMLAFLDHTLEIRLLAQRANRANVTFYAVDPRGLAVFDDLIGPMRPATPAQDRERLASRQGGLREIAGNTDGAVVLNTNDVKGGVARIMADLGLFYPNAGRPTNPKLDGRFRSITVRVKRPGVRVRARAGYLAPTEAEARARGASVAAAALPAGVTPIARKTAVTALRRGPSTGFEGTSAQTSPDFAGPSGFESKWRFRPGPQMPSAAC